MERVGAEMEWSRLHHKNSQAFVSTLANVHLRLNHRWMIQIHKCKEHTIMDFLDSVPLILLHDSVLCQNCGRGVSRQDGLGGCGWKIRSGLTSIAQEFTSKCTVSALWLSSLGGHA